MTDKDLRKLSREDLLQLLLEQGREVQQLREKLAAAEKALDDRTLKMDKAGSIAEASLQLNGVFEAAEAACRQYTDNIRQLSARQEEVSAKLEAESRARAEALIAQAQREKAAMERETQARCAAMVENAEKESKMYWDDVSAALNKFLSAHSELRQMLSSVPKGSGNKP